MVTLSKTILTRTVPNLRTPVCDAGHTNRKGPGER
jgi:hypothetical protein